MNNSTNLEIIGEVNTFTFIERLAHFVFIFSDLTYSGIPPTKLGTYLENRVNNFLKNKDAGAGDVTIKVLSSGDKVVEVKPGMKARLVPGHELYWIEKSMYYLMCSLLYFTPLGFRLFI